MTHFELNASLVNIVRETKKCAGSPSIQDHFIILTDLYIFAHYVLSIEEAVDLGSVFADWYQRLIRLNRLHLGPGGDQEKLFQIR